MNYLKKIKPLLNKAVIEAIFKESEKCVKSQQFIHTIIQDADTEITNLKAENEKLKKANEELILQLRQKNLD